MAARKTSLEAVQRAMYALLSAAGLTVYDEPPENPVWPYVTIGGGTEVLRNTMGRTGRACMADVHVWSQSGQDAAQDGFGEAYGIAATIDGALDDTVLDMSADGWACVLCQFSAHRPLRDPDGITRHLVLTYEILTEVV